MSMKLEHINLTLNKTSVLNDLSLEVEQGAFVSLLGQSGAGKTTTIKVIAGIIAQDSGRVLFDDEPVDGIPAHRRQTSIVFQDIRLFPHMNVLDNVAFPLRMQGIRKKERIERARQLLALVHLENIEQRRIDQISGGQQQRVALARALAPHPRYLLLDEPFSGLDETLRNNMRELVRELHNALGLTSILVTHNAEEALDLSDRIFYMVDGHIAQEGTPRELYESPQTREVVQCFGDCSELLGTVIDGIFTAGPLSICIDMCPCASDDIHGPACMIIRKSAIGHTTSSDPLASALPVSSCHYQGIGYQSMCSVGNQRLAVFTPLPLMPGAITFIRLEPEGCFVYPLES